MTALTDSDVTFQCPVSGDLAAFVQWAKYHADNNTDSVSVYDAAEWKVGCARPGHFLHYIGAEMIIERYFVGIKPDESGVAGPVHPVQRYDRRRGLVLVPCIERSGPECWLSLSARRRP